MLSYGEETFDGKLNSFDTIPDRDSTTC